MSTNIKNAGFTLVESVIAISVLGVAALSVTSLVAYTRSGIANSKAQFGSQSLRNSLSSTIANPAACTTAINKAIFNPIQSDINTAVPTGGGYPLTFTLTDGTKVDGVDPAPTPYSNYAISLAQPGAGLSTTSGLIFQTVGAAVALNSAPGVPLVDPNPTANGGNPNCDLNNSVYDGDVYVAMNKPSTPGETVAGGTGIRPALIGTLLITVQKSGPHKNEICRCYTPDPCSALKGYFNPTSNPTCQVCGLGANGLPQTWVGNDTLGKAICLPTCAQGQFLVSDGSGVNAVCKAPLPIITGACGSSSGATLATAPVIPTPNLCLTGTPTAVSGTGPWTWGCNGANGGTSTTSIACKANLLPTPKDGVCGPPSGKIFASAAAANAAGPTCTSGTSSLAAFVDGASWVWTCTSTTGGKTASCSAKETIVNGVCPPPTKSATRPIATCMSGVPTAIVGAGPWLWGCDSPNGGSNTSPTACTVAVVSATPTPSPGCPDIPWVPLAAAPVDPTPHGGWDCYQSSPECTTGWVRHQVARPHGGWVPKETYCAEPEGQTTIYQSLGVWGGVCHGNFACVKYGLPPLPGNTQIPPGPFTLSFSCSDGKTETVTGTCGENLHPGEELTVTSDTFN